MGIVGSFRQGGGRVLSRRISLRARRGAVKPVTPHRQPLEAVCP